MQINTYNIYIASYVPEAKGFMFTNSLNSQV